MTEPENVPETDVDETSGTVTQDPSGESGGEVVDAGDDQIVTDETTS